MVNLAVSVKVLLFFIIFASFVKIVLGIPSTLVLSSVEQNSVENDSDTPICESGLLCMECLQNLNCVYHQTMFPLSRYPNRCAHKDASHESDFFVVRTVSNWEECSFPSTSAGEDSTEQTGTSTDDSMIHIDLGVFGVYSYKNKTGTGLLWEDEHPGFPDEYFKNQSSTSSDEDITETDPLDMFSNSTEVKHSDGNSTTNAPQDFDQYIGILIPMSAAAGAGVVILIGAKVLAKYYRVAGFSSAMLPSTTATFEYFGFETIEINNNIESQPNVHETAV